MAGAPAHFDELVEKRIEDLRKVESKPPFNDDQLRTTVASLVEVEQALSLLTDDQRGKAQATLLEFDILFGTRRHKLGEFVSPSNWFYGMTAAQRQQVVDYYATQAIGPQHHQGILWWYESRQEFRFEKPSYPVVTR